MSEICTNQCRWIAPLSIVSLMFAVLVPYAASGLVVYTVSSESVARGSSDGFGSEASDDGAVNVKTEGAATARVDVLEWADTSLLPLVDGHATGIRRDLVGQVEGFRVDLRQDVNVLDARAGQAIALANFQVSGLRADLRTQINAQANKLNDHIGEVEIRLRPLLGNANESLIRFPGLIEETSRSLAEVREATVRLERETTALVRNVRASSINFREATIRAKARPPWWLRWLPGK